MVLWSVKHFLYDERRGSATTTNIRQCFFECVEFKLINCDFGVNRNTNIRATFCEFNGESGQELVSTAFWWYYPRHNHWCGRCPRIVDNGIISCYMRNFQKEGKASSVHRGIQR
ncbi:hypothetical protein M3J09_001839 [Ascochyta lentis]